MRLLRLWIAAVATISAGGALALDLVFFSRPGCVYCRQWEKDVAPIYQKSDEGRRAPLLHWNLSDGASPYALREPVRYTPTFVLTDKGREIGRITGYINDAMFWGLLGKLLKDNEAATAMAPAAPGEKK